MADWTWHQGAIAGCSGRGAIIVGCHCSPLWLGRVTTNFGGVDVVPLQGAIVAGGGRVTNFGGVDVVPLLGAIPGCHCSGEGDDQLWGSGRGANAGCHCSVLSLGGHFFSTLITT